MLFETYRSLVRHFPTQYEGLFGQQISDTSGLWLAVDAQGYPSFLLTSQPTDARADIELRFVGVRFSRECEIATDDSNFAHGTYTIVRLEENDPDLVRLFLRLLEEAFCSNDAPRTNRAIGEQILELANLFRQIENSSKDIVGLWGELQVIIAAPSREDAARCWCQQKNAKYDFVCDDFAVEVKATLKPNREHRFALEQLRPPNGDVPVFIASAQLVQVQGGKAVFELLDEILHEIYDVDLRKAFMNSCIAKGGEDIYKTELRYQFLSRDIGLVYYSAADIPVPLVESTGPISKVKFDVCLDGLPQQVGTARSRLLSLNSNCPK